MRQAGDANEAFRGQLNRLAKGTFTQEDWEDWRPRELTILNREENQLFLTTATKLCALRADMTEFNVNGLKSTGNPLIVIKSKNYPPSASTYGSDKAQGIGNCLPVTKNCSVMLTLNLWPEAKLVNGSKGTVR